MQHSNSQATIMNSAEKVSNMNSTETSNEAIAGWAVPSALLDCPQAQPGQPAPTVFVTTLGSKSTCMTCPHCHEEIDTDIKTSRSSRTWLSGCIIFILVGWVCCCCLIPCCLKRCKNVKHFCPNCKGFIGKYNRG